MCTKRLIINRYVLKDKFDLGIFFFFDELQKPEITELGYDYVLDWLNEDQTDKIGQHMRHEYWRSSEDAESRDYNMSC